MASEAYNHHSLRNSIMFEHSYYWYWDSIHIHQTVNSTYNQSIFLASSNNLFICVFHFMRSYVFQNLYCCQYLWNLILMAQETDSHFWESPSICCFTLDFNQFHQSSSQWFMNFRYFLSLQMSSNNICNLFPCRHSLVRNYHKSGWTDNVSKMTYMFIILIKNN